MSLNLAFEWTAQSREQRLAAISELIHGPWPPKFDYMELVKAPKHRGIFASIGNRFGFAIFGRDSIEVGEDILATHPELTRDIILTLAALQGLRTDQQSEEEPGKILHEHRAARYNGDLVPVESLRLLYGMQQAWGSQEPNQVTYYGSFDATPLYIRLVCRYILRYGPDILQATYRDRQGQLRTIQDALDLALHWLVQKIEAVPEHLFVYKRLNPRGFDNQTWKDSPLSHLFADGRKPNFDSGIAAIELQGYAYDALQLATQILGTSKQHERWRALAGDIQRNTLERFWMAEQRFFAQALNLDAQGIWQQLDTLASDAGVLFESNLMLDLPANGAWPYLEDTARELFGPDFLTNAGIRSRSLRHFDIPGFAEYHGSLAVWPKETFDIAKGLHKHRLHALAAQLENRLLTGVLGVAEFAELFYVAQSNEVFFDNTVAQQYLAQNFPNNTAPISEPGQAWTIAAVLNILYRRQNWQPPQPTAFEQQILATTPLVPPP